jgi:hypothetical protein
MRCLVFGFVILMGCGSGGDARHKSAACERLRDHLVELQLARATHIDADRHRTAMRRGLGPKFVDRCQQLARAEIDCALAAADPAEAARCTSPRKATR